MTELRQSAFSTLIALMVFISMLAGPAVGPAQAIDYEECAKDYVFGSVLETAFDYLMGNPNHCLEIAESDFTNQSRVDLIASLETTESTSDDTLVQVDNRLQDSQSVALTKAKITIVNELNNGSTRQEATDAAKETISDYYAGIERQLYVTWDKQLLQIRYVSATEFAETGSRDSWVYADDWNYPTEGSGGQIKNDSAHESIPNATLVNGSTVDTDGLTAVGDGNSDGIYDIRMYYHFDSQITSSGDQGSGITRIAGDDGSSTRAVLETGAYANALSEIESQNSSATANIYPYVDSIYNNYTAGELDTSDILSPTELYQEASTNRSSTGYYGWAAIQLASLGYSGDTEHSHIVETVWNGSNVTWEGTIFYTGDDVDSFQTGVEYNPTNLSGSVMMAVKTSEETAEIRELEENFTITEATDLQTGETLNETSMDEKVYSITNASELEAELDKLRELRQELDNQSTFLETVTSGGGGLFAGGIVEWAKNNPAAAAVTGGVGVIVFLRILAPGP